MEKMCGHICDVNRDIKRAVNRDIDRDVDRFARLQKTMKEVEDLMNEIENFVRSWTTASMWISQLFCFVITYYIRSQLQ